MSTLRARGWWSHLRGDDEWNDRMEEAEKVGYTPTSWSKLAPHLKNWWKLAPQLLEFMNEPAHGAA